MVAVDRNEYATEKVHELDCFEFKRGEVRIFWDYAPGGRIVMLYAFTKRSQRTPRNDIAAGRRALRELRDELEAE